MAAPHPPSPRQLRERARPMAAAPRKSAAARPRRGYWRRHWRGELHLGTTVIVGAAIVWAAFSALRWGQARVDITESPELSAGLWLAEVATLMLGAVWWGIGVARAAAAHREQGGSSLVSMLAAAVGVAACGWAAMVWFQSARHHAPEVWAIASGKAAPAQVTVDAARGEAVLVGDLEFGSKRALRRVLDAHPELRWVRLESRGGRALEGLRIGQLIAERGLDTVVSGECSSACVTAFAGGSRRWIARNARLGLHSAGGAVSAEEIARVNAEHDAFMRERGVAWRVLEKGQAVAADSIWFPEPVTLLASGLATDYAPAAR
ncbi:MAG: hypothetical protein ACK5OR_04535 [Betaproteobacteria bacterium]